VGAIVVVSSWLLPSDYVWRLRFSESTINEKRVCGSKNGQASLVRAIWGTRKECWNGLRLLESTINEKRVCGSKNGQASLVQAMGDKTRMLQWSCFEITVIAVNNQREARLQIWNGRDSLVLAMDDETRMLQWLFGIDWTGCLRQQKHSTNGSSSRA